MLVQCTAAPPPPAAYQHRPLHRHRRPRVVDQRAASTCRCDRGAGHRRRTRHDLAAGLPVEPEQLRRVSVDYLGFDGQTHRGDLIVHEDLVPEVIAIFERLYRLGYPVEKIRTVDHYPDADDELSMEDNNTSAFNCRRVPGTDDWSPHAYGRAIDLNPLVNPCLYASGYFEPRNAAAYLDRSRTDPGLLHVGDPAVHAFTDRGWRWGGEWAAPLDYQHFERT